MSFARMLLGIFLISLFSCYSTPKNTHNIIDYSVISSPNMIIDINIQVFNKDISGLEQNIKDEIIQNNGEITQENIENGNRHIITARIQKNNTVNFIENVKTFGVVVNETINSSNIGMYSGDTEMLLNNSKNMLGKYYELLKTADSISDILTLEKEINNANMEIEMLERRRMEFMSRLEYNTITIVMYNK